MRVRVIDLLNKIANDEKVPETIYYCGNVFKWTGLNYYCTEKDEFLDKYICLEDLEYEAEIIEEHKIPEKIEYIFNLKYIDTNDKDLVINEVNKTINGLYKKYNEIIDYLKENK